MNRYIHKPLDSRDDEPPDAKFLTDNLKHQENPN